MSEDEGFLARWSRRKRDAAEGRGDEPEASSLANQTVAITPEPAAGEQPDRQPGEAPGEPLIDLSKLPPIESIAADTDIRAFLAPGVPEELRRAALRRAWSADTSIRDFIGLVENDWDVLAPAAAAGVQPLTVTDQMRRMVDALFSKDAEPQQTLAAPAGGASPASSTPAVNQQPPPSADGQPLVPPPETAGAQAMNPAPPAAPAADTTEGPAAAAGQQATRSTAATVSGASHQIDAATHNETEESHRFGVAGRRGHGRALPT